MKDSKMLHWASLATCLFLALGCGVVDEDDDLSWEHSDADADSDSTNDSDSSATDGGGTDDDTGVDTDTLDDDCSENSKYIYVVDSGNGFWRFNPMDTETPFDFVATLSCPGGGSPFSMAISRDERAYVLYWENGASMGINEVDINTGACSGSVGFSPGQFGFSVFGMGFATDGPDTVEETLYIGKAVFDPLGAGGSQLASLDIETWEVTPIGPISHSPELTGNQNGELWGYMAWDPDPRVVRFDKGTAAESQQAYLPSNIGSGTSAFAFAFWGGDFYLFHAPPSSMTTVYRLHEGVFEEWVGAEMQVVGAGVSTCAPVVVE